MRLAGAALALAALGLAGCASVPPPDALLSGVALTRQRVSLPGDSVFEAALLQWPGGGAPPVVLARQRIDDAGSPPYALALPYRQAAVTRVADYAEAGKVEYYKAKELRVST